MAKIKLPVSMEDEELFPRGKFGINDHEKFRRDIFEEMFQNLDKIWWSRLVTAVRGYIVNDFKDDDSLIFTFDDSFIYLHRCLVEGTRDESLQVIRDIEILEQEGTESLQSLQEGYGLPESKDPFRKPRTRGSFCRLFGQPAPETYVTAFKQGFCYLVFFSIFCKLQTRFEVKKNKPKAVTFQEDAEWQPDDRVVIFQQFHQGIIHKLRDTNWGFRGTIVKQCIHEVLLEELGDKEYDANEVPQLTKTVSQAIKERLKGLDLERYKFIVQVVIGELRGEGAKMVCRCFWDSDTDGQAHDIFMNSTLFCVATAFGVFYY